MNKQLRKRVLRERQIVYDLINDIKEGRHIDNDEYYIHLEAIYCLLDDIIQDISQEAENEFI